MRKSSNLSKTERFFYLFEKSPEKSDAAIDHNINTKIEKSISVGWREGFAKFVSIALRSSRSVDTYIMIAMRAAALAGSFETMMYLNGHLQNLFRQMLRGQSWRKNTPVIDLFWDNILGKSIQGGNPRCTWLVLRWCRTLIRPTAEIAPDMIAAIESGKIASVRWILEMDPGFIQFHVNGVICCLDEYGHRDLVCKLMRHMFDNDVDFDEKLATEAAARGRIFLLKAIWRIFRCENSDDAWLDIAFRRSLLCNKPRTMKLLYGWMRGRPPSIHLLTKHLEIADSRGWTKMAAALRELTHSRQS